MKMRKIPLLISLVVVGLGLQQCSTELEINAPYKEFTTIYGLLDAHDSQHLVKVNKSFLGEGNALDMAQVADSSEYDPSEIEIFVERLSGGSVVETFTLHDTTVDVRVPGTFYYPTQRLWTFNSGGPLVVSDLYRIRCEVADRTVLSTTELVYEPTPVSQSSEVRFMGNTGGYVNYTFKWRSGKNGKRFQCYYRFNYTEVRASGDTPRTITQLMGTSISDGLNGLEEMNAVLNGETFYRTVQSTIVVDDPDVLRREIGDVDLLVEVANEDLNTYLQLNEPITGIVEDRPAFNNIENGIGLFVSRTTREFADRPLSDRSVEELVEGQYTGALRFCKPGSAPPLGCN